MSGPRAYSSVIQDLLRDKRLPPLGPGTPNEDARAQLMGLTNESVLAPHSIQDKNMAAACRAGLWLHQNYVDEAHTISQDIETPTGSYWHGLVHRREPDFSNSKYWFRRVGVHPVFEPLCAAAAELARDEMHSSVAFLKTQTAWDPFAFIDLCEAVERGRSPSEMLCRRIQLREWELLFDYCWRAAAGAEAA